MNRILCLSSIIIYLQYTVDQKNMQMCTKVLALINNISEYTYKFVYTAPVYIIVGTRILKLMSILIVPYIFFQKIYIQYEVLA